MLTAAVDDLEQVSLQLLGGRATCAHAAVILSPHGQSVVVMLSKQYQPSVGLRMPSNVSTSQDYLPLLLLFLESVGCQQTMSPQL